MVWVSYKPTSVEFLCKHGAKGIKEKATYYCRLAIKDWRSLRSSGEIPENWTPIPEPGVLPLIVATVFQITFADMHSDSR